MPGRNARDFAAELCAAELDGSSADLPTERFPHFDWPDARHIARERDALRRSGGDEQIGYKLGWTSAAMREALGIDQPNWGTLWRSQQCDGQLDLTRLRHPKAEPELVFVAGEPLQGPNMIADDVLASAVGWAIGIEVVHPRFESYDFTWLDNTADNSSAGAIATGPVSSIANDPSAAEVRFSNGLEERTGSGEQAMGSPAAAVAWLVHQLHEEGKRLRAGEIVYTGGLTAPFDVTGESKLTAQCPDLGSVQISISRNSERAPDDPNDSPSPRRKW